ncbi:MAG: DUF1003 domain-containing protein [Bdellovibrionales bacterium]|nr:DUF1003 domain-containing protein [Bdellovibrionales bacterium]
MNTQAIPSELHHSNTIKALGSLSEEAKLSINSAVKPVHLEAGEYIFQVGDDGDALYFVEEGTVELYIKDHAGGQISLAVLEPGEIFGEIAVLDGGSRTASAVCRSDVLVQRLDRSEFVELLHSNTEIGLALLALIANRLREADAMLRSRVIRNPNEEAKIELSLMQRIANVIADFSGSIPFLIINFCFFFFWILLNVDIIPGISAFDPYPFGFLTMAVSLEAIFLSIFVLLAQNLQAVKDRIRNDIEYDVNLKAELEITQLHEKLDRLSEGLSRKLQSLSLGR